VSWVPLCFCYFVGFELCWQTKEAHSRVSFIFGHWIISETTTLICYPLKIKWSCIATYGLNHRNASFDCTTSSFITIITIIIIIRGTLKGINTIDPPEPTTALLVHLGSRRHSIYRHEKCLFWFDHTEQHL